MVSINCCITEKSRRSIRLRLRLRPTDHGAMDERLLLITRSLILDQNYGV